MRNLRFTCEQCHKEFLSEHALDILLPRCIPILCNSCVNEGAISHAKEAAHSFIDKLFTALLGK